MKNKITGYLLSAIFVIVVLAVVYRVTFLRNLVMGSPASTPTA